MSDKLPKGWIEVDGIAINTAHISAVFAVSEDWKTSNPGIINPPVSIVCVAYHDEDNSIWSQEEKEIILEKIVEAQDE